MLGWLLLHRLPTAATTAEEQAWPLLSCKTNCDSSVRPSVRGIDVTAELNRSDFEPIIFFSISEHQSHVIGKSELKVLKPQKLLNPEFHII